MDPLPDAAFARLLADLWRQQGWEADTARRGDGTYLVGGERGRGTRGLILVLPDPGVEVRTAHLRTFVKTCGRRGVDVAVVATQGTFTGEVRRVAADRGVHLLDTDRLEKTIRKGGFEAVLRRHRGDDGATEGESGGTADRDADGADTNDADADADGWEARLRAALPDAASALRARAAGDPRRLLAVVVAVAVLTSGVVIGVPTGGGGDAATVAVSAVSTATPDAGDSLAVRWNAATRSTLDTPGGTFGAPPNETFVVVRLDVTNRAGDPAMFGGASLVFESDGVRYGFQPLSGANLATMDRFESGDADTVWAVFSVPANATTGTVLVRNGLAADGPGVRFVHDPSLSVEFDAPASESASASDSTADESEAAASLVRHWAAIPAVDPPSAPTAVSTRRSLGGVAAPFGTQIINRPRP